MSQAPDRSDTDVVGERVGAQFIDLLLMGMIFFGAFLVMGFVSALLGEATESSEIFDAIFAIGLLATGAVVLGYSFVLEAVWNGQTVGKRLAGIRVVSESGEEIGAGKAFIRNIPAFFSGSWLAYLVALLSMAATDRRQRLFDSLAGTVVVDETFTSAPEPDTAETGGREATTSTAVGETVEPSTDTDSSDPDDDSSDWGESSDWGGSSDWDDPENDQW